MNAVIEQLNANLKLIYRQALDADSQLDELQKQGHAKFTALFPKDAGFGIEAKRFKPYVLDLAADVEALASSESVDESALKVVVNKMAKLHALLGDFKAS